MQDVQPELGEQLTELFILSAALYFRSVDRSRVTNPTSSPDALHQSACSLLSLSENWGLTDEARAIQVQRGIAQLVEGLMDAAFAAQRCNDGNTARELQQLSQSVAALAKA